MKRIRCKFCGAKPRAQFAVSYAGHEMCAECKYEYQSILEGQLPTNRLMKVYKEQLASEFENLTTSEMLDLCAHGLDKSKAAFMDGWRKFETDEGLSPILFSEEMEREYERLYKKYFLKLDNKPVDLKFNTISNLKSLSIPPEVQKYYDDLLRGNSVPIQREDQDGISEDT